MERFASNNDLHTFITGVNQEMATEYERIRRRASEDPGTAGDQGEENWATLLREWLPPYLQIVTKGRILNAQGEASPQVDVLVLSPAYPKRLLDKKLYLAGGVEAAFECKITLEAKHIEKAAANAATIRRLLSKRTGTPYKELNSPLIYGLLAHSHSWKGAASTPIDNVTDKLWKSDLNHAAHPREMLDLLCVADLAAWAVRKVTGEGFLPGQKPGYVTTEEPYAETTLSWSAPQVDPPFSRIVLDFHRIEGQTPIGSMLTDLLARLAWRHPSIKDLATFFLSAQLRGQGAGYVRQWHYDDIYSAEVRESREKAVGCHALVRMGMDVSGTLLSELPRLPRTPLWRSSQREHLPRTRLRASLPCSKRRGFKKGVEHLVPANGALICPWVPVGCRTDPPLISSIWQTGIPLISNLGSSS